MTLALVSGLYLGRSEYLVPDCIFTKTTAHNS
jgi:hypothetical protein